MAEYSGTIEESERLIRELYIDLRKRINYWASITKQTAQARMGYVGQHLVSIVTAYSGGKSGGRGKDLVISNVEYAEIKTCYRVDQLGKCNVCETVVASIEMECPACGSTDLIRRDDSKWLISIRHEKEYSRIIEPRSYYLVLFDFEDLQSPDTIRASIWEVDTKRPGFAYCMIDYYQNIRAKSKSKAPFNLWPFQLKFALMCPRLIYRAYIYKDDSIETQTFPGRDTPVGFPFDLSDYSRSKSLTVEKLRSYASALGINTDQSTKKKEIIALIEERLKSTGISSESACDTLAKIIYWPDIKDTLPCLPSGLKTQLDQARLV